MKNNKHSKYYQRISPFFTSLTQIPAFVIVCNAAGPLTEDDLYDYWSSPFETTTSKVGE